MERIVFFYWQQPLVIKIFQLLCHHVDVPQCFRGAPKPPNGHAVEALLLAFQCGSCSGFKDQTVGWKNVHKEYYQILTAVCSILQRDVERVDRV